MSKVISILVMKRIFNIITAAVFGVIAIWSCQKVQDPAQFEKPDLEPVIEALSTTSLFFECDDLKAQTITLTGKDLSASSVIAESVLEEGVESAFYISANGDMVHICPKEPNVDPDNQVEETISIYVMGAEPFNVTVTQSRMDKPMFLSLDPDELRWDYNEVDERVINVDGLNVNDADVTLTSSSSVSAFNVAYADYKITVSPKAENESTETAKEEIFTISVARGNSLTFTVKQSKAPKPIEVLYESAFDVAGTSVINVYNANVTDYEIDGKTWSLTWACFTAQYKLSGKNSHILASVRTGGTGPAVMTSSNLLEKESKVTSFTVSLARRNANDGWCTVEYSVDGETWQTAGPDFQALQSSSKVQGYTYELDIDETKIFQVRIKYHFNGNAVAAHTFLNFDGIKVMGY